MRHSIGLAVTGSLMLAAAPAEAKSPIEGLWRTPKGTATVRIAPCGQQLCGRMIDASRQVKRKAKKQGAPNIVGKTVLNSIQPVGPNRWKSQVFVPRLGRHVGGKLVLNGQDRLTVQGCIAGLICKSQDWHRVD
jgi:uncharacterized protein (DUF2147 family)